MCEVFSSLKVLVLLDVVFRVFFVICCEIMCNFEVLVMFFCVWFVVVVDNRKLVSVRVIKMVRLI